MSLPDPGCRRPPRHSRLVGRRWLAGLRPRLPRRSGRSPAVRAGAALVVITGAGLLALAAAGPAAATPTPTPSALPPTGACAAAVSVVVGKQTSPPTPLPTPVSAVGGAELSAPGLHVDVPAGAAPPPQVRATSWLVVDVTTGNVLAACNAHVQLAPASTLKVLTALVLVHRLNWSAGYVGRPADPATDGSKVGIVTGSSYTVSDLLHGLMLSSGNDAATALATAAGGMPATVQLMNAEARWLGAFDTRAVNDSGLDAPGQVSSAYDLALLGRAALADPLLAGLVRTTTYEFPGKGTAATKNRHRFQIQNHNWLLRNYPGATGVKNGYTVAAGGSYIGSATRGGHTYLVTALRAEGYTWRVAKALLDWAFTVGPQARPVGVLVGPGQATAAQATAGAQAASGAGSTPATGDPVLAGSTGSVAGLGWALPVLAAATGLGALAGLGFWWRLRRRGRSPAGPPPWS